MSALGEQDAQPAIHGGLPGFSRNRVKLAPVPEFRPDLGDQFGQARRVGVEIVRQLFPDPPGHGRAAAAGGDRQGERRLPHNSGQDEVAVGRIVGGIERHANGAGVGLQPFIGQTMVARGHDQRPPVHVARPVLPCQVLDSSRVTQCCQFLVERGRHDRDAGLSAEQSLDLFQREPSTANHQHRAALQIEEDGIVRARHVEPAASASYPASSWAMPIPRSPWTL